MLGDLGLGKAMDMSSRLTMIGGTPSFVSPEQAQGEPLDARADQFSLAALAYLLLAGRAPYNHTSLNAAADPGPPPPLDNGLPDEAEAVLAQGVVQGPRGEVRRCAGLRRRADRRRWPATPTSRRPGSRSTPT